MTTHTEWFSRITRGDSNRQVAERAHVSDATLGRQLRAGTLAADMIIKVAEAYNESPVIALVDLGFMSARWVTEPGVVTALSRASDEELTDELLRRLNLLSDAPVDQLASERSNVHQLHVGDVDDDEAALREANELRGAAQKRTPRLDEPDSP